MIQTDQFDLAVFHNQSKRKSNYLHVYIEGDGQPFIQNRYINADPTSTQGLMLDLMALDTAPSVLIGRPCYHHISARNCQNSKWWTSRRYSPEIVTSIAQAIGKINVSDKDLRLIGFSGGGSIALLLARELKEIDELITISANIDTKAWTEKHSYTPLYGSLNPIEHLSDMRSVKQTHLIGELDHNIPYKSWQRDVARQENTEVKIYSGVSHNCCWQEIWRELTQALTP